MLSNKVIFLKYLIMTFRINKFTCEFDYQYGIDLRKWIQVDRIILPDNIKNIGNFVFSECNMTEIDIPNSVLRIGASSFEICRNLKTVHMGNSVISIENLAFDGCQNLKNINLSTSLIQIGSYAFVDCESLEEITIPNNVVLIGSHAFDGCRNLKSINIPDSVKYIGENAFKKCDQLIIKVSKQNEHLVKKYRYKIIDDNNELSTVDKVKKILSNYEQINDFDFQLITRPNFRIFNADFINELYNNLVNLKSKINENQTAIIKLNEFIQHHNQESENILNIIYESDKDKDDSEFITFRTPN